MLYQKKKKYVKGWLRVLIFTGLLMITGCKNDGSAVILTGTEAHGESENITEESSVPEMVGPSDSGIVIETAAEVSATEAGIYVHICGQVVASGVYELPAGSRVWDAVEAAGGFTEEADPEAINLAFLIVDGCKITIPARGQTEEEIAGWYQVGTGSGIASGSMGSTEVGANTGTYGNGAVTSSGLVDINRADVTILMTIPGIGQVRAEAIVAYRKEQGPFESIEEIMEVAGIKEGLFSQIREYITVGG